MRIYSFVLAAAVFAIGLPGIDWKPEQHPSASYGCNCDSQLPCGIWPFCSWQPKPKKLEPPPAPVEPQPCPVPIDTCDPSRPNGRCA